jgi:hypothetical protein
MGIPRRRCFLSGAGKRSLQMRQLLHSQHTRLPCLRIHGIVSATLPVAIMTPHQHFRALTDELTEHTAQANNTPKGWCLLKLLGTRIKTLLHPPPILEEQRVIAERQHKAREAEQRVIDDSPIISIPQITDVLPVMLTCNPTAKQTLRTTPQLHRRVTCNNTPGILPVPNVITPTPMPTATNSRQT